MTDAVLLERDRGLLTLRLNRPDKKNALPRAMCSQLAEADITHAIKYSPTIDIG